MTDTIARLAAFRQQQGRETGSASLNELMPFENFGPNPGELDGWLYLPTTRSGKAPLVVVLHGCTQNAHEYDRGAGWSQLADELGFAVLLPEQRRSNNFNLCFNWYEQQDSRRDAGEAASIKQMVDALVGEHDIDPRRVFITGLSAGGAMTSVMLAAYPETFAAGAIIAGLPYGSATGVQQAFDRMRGHGSPSGPALASLVREASTNTGPWPHISVWHGTSDNIVVASNADDIIEQWRPLHGASERPNVVDEIEGYPHRVWHDHSGRPVIQDYRITAMGHGTPLATTGSEACGVSGAHMLEADISSTRRIAYDWGLGGATPQIGARPKSHQKPALRQPSRGPARRPHAPPASAGVGSRIGKTIEDSLRVAGLIK